MIDAASEKMANNVLVLADAIAAKELLIRPRGRLRAARGAFHLGLKRGAHDLRDGLAALDRDVAQGAEERFGQVQLESGVIHLHNLCADW